MPENSASKYVPDAYDLDSAIVNALPAAVEKYYPGSRAKRAVVVMGMDKLGPQIVKAVKDAVAKEMAEGAFQGELNAADTAALAANDDEDFIPPVTEGGNIPQESGESDVTMGDEPPAGADAKKNPSLKNAQNPGVNGVAGSDDEQGEGEEPGLSPENVLDEFGEGGAEEEPLTPEEEELAALNGDSPRGNRGSQGGRRKPQPRPPEPPEQEAPAPETSEAPETATTEEENEEKEQDEEETTDDTGSQAPQENTGEQAPETPAEENAEDEEAKKEAAKKAGGAMDAVKETAEKENPDKYNQFDQMDENGNPIGPGEEGAGGPPGEGEGEGAEGEGNAKTQKNPQAAEEENEEKKQEEQQELEAETQQEKIEKEIANRQKKLEKEVAPKLKQLNKEIADKKKKERWLEAKIILRTPVAIVVLFFAVLFIITIIFFAFGGMLAQVAFSMFEQSAEDTVKIFKLRKEMKEKETEKKKLAETFKKEQMAINKLAKGRNKLLSFRRKKTQPTQ